MTSNTAFSLAFGIATRDSKGNVIEVFYPQPILHPSTDLMRITAQLSGYSGSENGFVDINLNTLEKIQTHLLEQENKAQASVLEQLSKSDMPVVACLLYADKKPSSVPEAFLKLHLLSHRLVKPNEQNLDGIFGVLHNIAWTNKGPVTLDDLPARQLQSRMAGELLEVMSVDKFPKMTNYVVPQGVRIAHTARVRLGAYLGEGTTVMHEGFVNYNAGSAGKAMIEGRISASVWVGEGSDLGGGCSIMGTLSGGGTQVITVGENCLIGANAGIGFPLGNGCIVEAGLYVTAGTKIKVLNEKRDVTKTMKALELSGQDNLLYRRNSLTGAVECVPNKTGISLNEDLHSHN